MGQSKKLLPIGIENFEKLRTNDFYYIDKTGLIRELLRNLSEVTLFTRPRRFGKSLNMSMLAHFFSMGGDKHVFDGLEIAKETELLEKHMGKYPVVFLSLKDIDAGNYKNAFQSAALLMNRVARKHAYLLDSPILSDIEKEAFGKLLGSDMAEGVFCDGLRLLCELLEKHFGSKVVLLIDEYDVPLARAHANGYYDQMISLIRSLLGAALKTNDSLAFAVLTGCLRVSKESIFTGLNNLAVFSMSNPLFSEYFGFTDSEVRELLAYYGVSACYKDTKRWYDGYLFGSQEVYCPWDVLNHCRQLVHNPSAPPQNYWINTSGNDAVKRFIGMAGDQTRNEIERLVAGESIQKEVREELTYQDMYDNIDNLWSLLFMTGYLTQCGTADGCPGQLAAARKDWELDGRAKRLAIPNLEVRDVFVMQIRDDFKENVKADTDTLSAFCAALANGDAATVERLFSRYLEKSISIRDRAVPDARKENFYHGVMLGILMANDNWSVLSNREAGEGYADILAKSEDGETGIVIEIKYADDGELERACQDALGQMDARRYMDAFQYTRVQTIRKYGVGCYKKTCKVVSGA